MFPELTGDMRAAGIIFAAYTALATASAASSATT
jgi:hypothetical protein